MSTVEKMAAAALRTAAKIRAAILAADVSPNSAVALEKELAAREWECFAFELLEGE